MTDQSTKTAEQFIKPGVYSNIDFPAYIKIEAVNWHTIEPYRISPKQARMAMTLPEDASDAMRVGQAFHAAVLEPKKFDEQYCVMPAFDGHPNSNVHKDAKRAWLDEHKSLVTMTHGEHEALKAESEAVRAHPLAGRLFDGKCRNELTIIFRGGKEMPLMKGRIDRIGYAPAMLIYPEAKNVGPKDRVACLMDFKTTRAPWPGAFEREIGKFGYHGQLAMYYDGLQSLQPGNLAVLIVAIQNSAPWEVVVYRLDEDILEQGRILYRRLLRDHMKCLAARHWPGVAETIQQAILPPWSREHEDPSLGD